MASRPTNALPVLYNELLPISRHDHKNWRFRLQDKLPFMSEIHAIPLAVEEFGMAQRNFPIVFSSGPNPVPLALMGLNDGVNVFFDEEGNCRESHIYLPAYIRRYPFMLAKI
ncbi:SapC family protein, partial [Zymomonas sp.]|uniref:SapC family protein n=1 Tax=Zymomonas sp. TaxID=2068624 RepID=UPI0025CC9881